MYITWSYSQTSVKIVICLLNSNKSQKPIYLNIACTHRACQNPSLCAIGLITSVLYTNGVHKSAVETQYNNIRTNMMSFRQNYRYWLHRKLSKGQFPMQPVTKISSKWQFPFSESVKVCIFYFLYVGHKVRGLFCVFGFATCLFHLHPAAPLTKIDQLRLGHGYEITPRVLYGM